MPPADLDALAADIAGVVRSTAAATGEALTPPDVRAWTFDVLSGPDFRALVSACYTWWKEAWSSEVQTLAGFSQKHRGTLRDFTTTVNSLRTSHQHNRDLNATAFAHASAWTVKACGTASPAELSEWRACGDKFGDEIAAATAALAAAAAAVAADPALAKQWASLTAARKSVDLVATADVVMEDLRRSYSPSQLEYMRRQIEGQWKRRRVTAADDAQAALEAVVEKVVIGAALTPLECGGFGKVE